MSLLLRKTSFGVSVYMMGSNEKATLFAGIRVKRVTLKIYALSGFYCGIAALIMISRFNSAKAGYASSYLLVTILAAVQGGVDPFGGFGKMIGLVLALLVLQVISSGVNLLGMSAHLTMALWGDPHFHSISESIEKSVRSSKILVEGCFDDLVDRNIFRRSRA